MADLFARHGAQPAADVLDGIRAALSRRRYVSNLIREVEKELRVHAAN
jgi:hypothetical protein